MADLTITISGDLKNYENALKTAQEKTEALSSKLTEMATIAGVAFAALTAEQAVAIKAFAESQEASNSLTQALQNQGIYSDELADNYKNQAAELQKLTGIDDDAIIKAQGVLQGMIGQQEITMDLTKSITDLSVAKGMDLNTTAELIGKGINGHVAALGKLGIQIDEHLNKEERTARIIELVNAKFGDQAIAANQGLGGIKGLTSAFGDFQENIGERLAPAVEFLIKNMTELFQTINEHQEIANFIVAVLSAGTVVAGLGLTLGIAGAAWLKYQAMMQAAGVATEAMSVATKGLVGAAGIGLLIIIATELYQHWGTVFPKMQDIYQVFVENISMLAGGIGKILQGVFSLDRSKLNEGLEQTKEAVTTGYDDINEIVTRKEEQQVQIKATQNEAKAELANQEQEREDQLAAYKQEQLDLERELTLAKLNDVSKEVIDLKTEELDTLKQLQEEKNAGIREELEAHLEELQSLNSNFDNQEKIRKSVVNAQVLANDRAFTSMSAKEQAVFLKQNEVSLVASLNTEQKARQLYALQQAQDDIKARNQFLQDQQKFGTAYALINKTMHSEEVTGFKAATADMSQLQNSKNREMKAVGKAAAIAQIIISTAQSAMNIMAGFSTIPIVGPILGAAAAGVMIAYGAERIGEVTAAAQGGVITGGIPNVDSVPAMLMPGELVVPKNNFEETVGAVANQRSGGSGGSANITIGFDSRTASQLLTILQIEDDKLGISPKGAA